MVSPNFDDAWMVPDSRVRDGHAPDAQRAKPRSARPARRRGVRRHFRITQGLAEAVVLLMVAALALIYAGTLIGEKVLRPQPAPVVTLKVEAGDTLWSLAERYGSPDEYILRRVDRLATFNSLEPGERLQPGMELRVPVENPAEQQRILVSNDAVR